MLFGKRLKRDLSELRREIEKKDREIGRLNYKFESLDKHMSDLSDRVASQSRIIKNHVDGEITYKNVDGRIWDSGVYVLIYKDRDEYKFDGINLDDPLFKVLSNNLLEVHNKGVSYIFNLSNEKIIRY